MEEEKRSREGKLRDRLAKKRKAKEQEMQEAALSERVRKRKRLLTSALNLKASRPRKCKSDFDGAFAVFRLSIPTFLLPSADL